MGELVALAPFEVVNRAIEVSAPFTVELVASPRNEVYTLYGVTVNMNDFLRMDNHPDMLIVPGGGWNHKAEHGARKEVALGRLTKLINEMHAKNWN